MHYSRRVGLFLLGVIVHGESLGYWFVAVDAPKLILSSRIVHWNDAVEILTQPLMHETAFPEIGLFYRPVASLSYSFDYWVWGVDPFGYHLTNLLLQGVAVVAVAVVIGELTGDTLVGESTAVLFAVHPLTAEVVPATPRRHDILMLLFLLASLLLFVRSQRHDLETERASYLSLGGSFVAYVLALGSKEPALVVPVLVFAWTALQQFDDDPYETLWRSVRATAPFGLVTAGYLAVRAVVLGGIGGYNTSWEIADVSAVLTAYLVSIAYPVDVLGNDLATGGIWTGVVLLIGALLAFVVLSAAVSVAKGHVVVRRYPLVVLFVGGCVLIGVLVSQISLASIIGQLPDFTPTPYSSLHTTSGLLLVVTGLLGGLWGGALPSMRDRIDFPTLSFFIVWFAIPLALYVQGGQYLLRTGYASIVPAMAILSVVLINALRELRASDRTLDRNAVLLGSVLLVVAPQVAVSPLFHPYDGWEQTGDVNRMVFTGLTDELDDRSGPTDDRTGTTTLRVHGLPNAITEQGDSFPQVQSIVYPGAQATGAWLRLSHPDMGLTVHSNRSTHLHSVPTAVSIDTTQNGDTVIATIQYEHRANTKD